MKVLGKISLLSYLLVFVSGCGGTRVGYYPSRRF
jgi:hypothetical protein